MTLRRNFAKIFTAILLIASLLLLSSCIIINNGGSLRLASFTVDRSSVKTAYLIGEEIDFSGIKATAKYSDETLNKIYTYDELTITYAEDITATVGEKEVTVSFEDPHLNVTQEAKVKITVTEEPVVTPPDGGDEEPETLIVAQFEKPLTITAFESANAAAGKTAYGATGFAGEFALGNQIYVIGNENEFKFKPLFAVLDENFDIVELADFFSVVTISIEKDGEYVELTKVNGEGNISEYYDGDTIIATVNTYTGTYNFSTGAAGAKVKISVIPSADHYETDESPMTLEAKIINAYNVYEAWQLAVIDNMNAAWDTKKEEHGIKGLNVSGIVLHCDIDITENDVPESFFYVSDKEIVYTDKSDPSNPKTIVKPAGSKFLIDFTFVYDRTGAGDFTMQGNFFTIDVSSFPLIASPAVFGADAQKDYSTDYSNATLFRFETVAWETYYAAMTTVPADVAEVTVENLSFIGNAKRNNYEDSDGNLVSAGGLIFFKSSHFTKTTMNNIIGNSGFITYFVDYGAELHVSNAKCYDSYQNAVFAFANTLLTFTDSFINGCGGPVAITQSVVDYDTYPVTVFTNTITETHLTGGELWFQAVGATAVIDGVKALGNGLGQAGLGNFLNSEGKLNIIGSLMDNVDDASALSDIRVQGSFNIDGTEANRFHDNALWQIIYNHPALTGGAPFLTVYGADGTPYTIFFNGATFCDLMGNALGTDASHVAILGAFQAADKIVLTQGGLSVIMEFYH